MTKNLVSQLLIVIAVFMFTVSAYADMFTAEPVNFTVTHKIENNESLVSVNNTFVLEAKNNAPMPEGSVGGVKTVTATANSSFEFGEITYPQEGTYEYTVTRKITNSQRLIQDDSEYLIRIAVFSDGSNVAVYEKAGEGGKSDELEYTDIYLTKLTFIMNGGTYKGSPDDVVQYHPAGTTVSLLSEPTKKNSEFLYWKGSKYAAGAKYDVTTEDHTFTAMYKKTGRRSSGSSSGSTTIRTGSGTRSPSGRSSTYSGKRTGAQTGDVIILSILVGALSAIILVMAVRKR